MPADSDRLIIHNHFVPGTATVTRAIVPSSAAWALRRGEPIRCACDIRRLIRGSSYRRRPGFERSVSERRPHRPTRYSALDSAGLLLLNRSPDASRRSRQLALPQRTTRLHGGFEPPSSR